MSIYLKQTLANNEHGSSIKRDKTKALNTTLATVTDVNKSSNDRWHIQPYVTKQTLGNIL